MKINWLLGNPNFQENIEQRLTSVDGEVFIFLAEVVFGENSSPNDFKGLDFALEIKTNGIPLVLCSSFPLSYFKNDKRLCTLMNNGNVAYMQYPFISLELNRIYNKLKLGMDQPQLN